MSFLVYGTMPAPTAVRWPASGPLQQPGSYEHYNYVATLETSAGTDPIISASLAIAPSGAGEMICDILYVVGQTATAWLRGGVAGRRYNATLTLSMTSGSVIPVPIVVQIDATTATWPLPAPPSIGFGTPITWTSGGSVLGPPAALPAVTTGLVATGINLATALLLPAQVNVFATVPTGTGFVLNPALISGTCRVINTSTNDLLGYPPATAHIGSGATGAPVIVSPGTGVDFSTNAPTVLWIAS